MNNNFPLFYNSGSCVDSSTIKRALEHVGADECEVLYIHSCISFGTPNPELSKSQLLNEIMSTILDLGVKTICMPTYTFSFCNRSDFNIRKSKSKMGALNEFFRKRDDVSRTEDPLLSVAVQGETRGILSNLGNSSIGAESNFAKLDDIKNVKFLFLGTQLQDCFTYMHYLEFLANVPYRYEREFSGNIIKDLTVIPKTCKLFVRYRGVFPNIYNTQQYEKLLEKKGIKTAKSVGASEISCLSKDPAKEIYFELLRSDPNYFITEPFDRSTVDKVFEFGDVISL